MDLPANGTVANENQLHLLLLESKMRRSVFAFFIAIAAVCGTTGDCLMLYVFAKHCRGDQRKKVSIWNCPRSSRYFTNLLSTGCIGTALARYYGC